MTTQTNNNHSIEENGYLIGSSINRCRSVPAVVMAVLMIGVFTTVLPAAGTKVSASTDGCLLKSFPTANQVDRQRIIRAASLEPMGVQWCFSPPENRGR